MASTAQISDPPITLRPEHEASWFWTVFTWTWVLGWLCLGATLCNTVGALAALLGDRKRVVAHKLLAMAYQAITRWHPRYDVTLRGVENLGGGAKIITPNHSSLSDVVYLYTMPGHYKWIIKKEFFRVPMFGTAMRVARYPAIDRGNIDSAMALFETVSWNLRRGVSILSFPEGSRSKSGRVERFNSGTVRMAIGNQVPLVPVGVFGTGRLMPPGSGMYAGKAHLVIVVGKPIPTEGLPQRAARKLNRELRQAVLRCKAEAQAIHDADPERSGTAATGTDVL